MSELKPHFTILVDQSRREVHFAASGFWSPQDMARFQSSLLEKSKPLYQSQTAFRVMGDLSGLAVQDRLMAESMRFMLHESEKLGMERLAIVITAPLVRMQYERLAEGSNTAIFPTKGDAIAWLRS
ncbi:MAG: hypothetical protein QNI87_10065 [Erythrobacter sp.]|uniref:hypothetical protein n=1 Tax=Erythrobacter sp. TaxID=1042 RepID=UPI00263971C7|nr:hypothetical protein [Erythrobacter sp.]MDJ0978872.1 hypothetical protein [Erythrobacter sp.]